MNSSEIVREILRERVLGPDRPTPHGGHRLPGEARGGSLGDRPDRPAPPPQSRAVSLHVSRSPLRTMGIWDARGGFPEIRPSEFDVGEEVVARAVAVERTSPAPLVHEVR